MAVPVGRRKARSISRGFRRRDPSAAATFCKAGETTPPTELVKQVPKGELHSPYPDYMKLAEDRKTVSPCHGGSGGGGICPAFTQGVWFWGNTDDVLLRLTTLGSVDLEKEGYKRFGLRHAPMQDHCLNPVDQSSGDQSS